MRLLTVCVVALVAMAATVTVQATPIDRLQQSLVERSSAAASTSTSTSAAAMTDAAFADAIFQANTIMHQDQLNHGMELQLDSPIDKAADAVTKEYVESKSPEHWKAARLVQTLAAAGVADSDASFIESQSSAEQEAEHEAEGEHEIEGEHEQEHESEQEQSEDEQTRSFLEHSTEAEMDLAAEHEMEADLMAESRAQMESSDHSNLVDEMNEADGLLKRGSKHFDDLMDKGFEVQAQRITEQIKNHDSPANWHQADTVNHLADAVEADDTVV